MMQRPYAVSCHCGNIRLEVDAELTNLTECNCSTCRRFGFIVWRVPTTSVRMLAEKRSLSTYAWRVITDAWHFCPSCGATMLLTGYSGGIVGVNARCIEHVEMFELKTTRFDGSRLVPPGPHP